MENKMNLWKEYVAVSIGICPWQGVMQIGTYLVMEEININIQKNYHCSCLTLLNLQHIYITSYLYLHAILEFCRLKVEI